MTDNNSAELSQMVTDENNPTVDDQIVPGFIQVQETSNLIPSIIIDLSEELVELGESEPTILFQVPFQINNLMAANQPQGIERNIFHPTDEDLVRQSEMIDQLILNYPEVTFSQTVTVYTDTTIDNDALQARDTRAASVVNQVNETTAIQIQEPPITNEPTETTEIENVLAPNTIIIEITPAPVETPLETILNNNPMLDVVLAPPAPNVTSNRCSLDVPHLIISPSNLPELPQAGVSREANDQDSNSAPVHEQTLNAMAHLQVPTMSGRTGKRSQSSDANLPGYFACSPVPNKRSRNFSI